MRKPARRQGFKVQVPKLLVPRTLLYRA